MQEGPTPTADVICFGKVENDLFLLRGQDALKRAVHGNEGIGVNETLNSKNGDIRILREVGYVCGNTVHLNLQVAFRRLGEKFTYANYLSNYSDDDTPAAREITYKLGQRFNLWTYPGVNRPENLLKIP